MMRFSSLRSSATIPTVVMLSAMLPGVVLSLAAQTDRQPDPAVVAGNVRDIRGALREIDSRIQQSLGRDALKAGSPNSIGADANMIRSELESVSKILKTLDQRLTRVQANDALKPAAGDKSQARRDYRPVTTEMEAIVKELDQCKGRVNKIEAIVVKQKSAAAQPLISDLDFINKRAENTSNAMKRVLSGDGQTGSTAR